EPVGGFLLGEDVRQREHGNPVGDPGEGRRGGGAHPLRRRVGGHQLGVGRLQPLELAHQAVVGGVGDRGPIEDVVAVIVGADLLAELADPVCCCGGGGRSLHARESLQQKEGGAAASGALTATCIRL